ncbi:FtsX-like permease family protein [Bradyrhizobium sp. WYCCWR 13022]|uniref:ABC transporter permease n=1 Tax=unclassified Bradyrhizobium TaxID=2631580 RepID=UPI00263A821F|nr:FtsX-like permease family protein [Bradyrhizobium sp. WYCCWR 13022]MDN4987072.1 FtsX-like permease family protein [Bradyrhizobium sp. WYCCWR 13022]
MSLLDRKLRRDIVAMRGQVLTIALLVAAGVAVFVGSVSTYDSLNSAVEHFYATARFPRLFVTLKRAPLSIVPQLTAIPGVATVEPRIVREVIVDWPAASQPVSARMVSLSHAGDERLARLHLRRGAAPEPDSARSAAVNEAFAEANGVNPGDDIRVVLNGKVEAFHVSGVALSPEYVYAVKPGLPIPDDRLYAILWFDRGAAEAAFDMKGAFNDAVISLAPGTDPKPVIDELDRVLEPYGSVGAVERRDQPSNRFLEDELNQQKVMSTTIPFIFFGIAAFLLNSALGRLVAAQREQIAALKALGFPTAALILHYLKLILVIVLIGSVLGIAAGWGFGKAMIASYQGFFRLPELPFGLTPWSAVLGIVISLTAASLGVLTALRQVVRLAPAIAMRPAAPLGFRRSWIEALLPRTATRSRRLMILRNTAGRPFRSLMTVIGVAFAVPMMVLGIFWRDAIDEMIDLQFNLVERGNATVTFPHPMERSIMRDLAREPGVLVAEGLRIVPVRLRARQRSYLTSVIGLSAGGELRRPHDAALRPIAAAPDGITLTRRLAERLDVKAGDVIAVEAMEGRRRKRDLPVSAIVDESIGMASYMAIETLNRSTDEGAVISAASLYVEPAAMPALGRRFKNLPTIESVSMKAYTLSSFMEKIAGVVFVTAGILAAFATIITVGVVYNSARISLQERAWELASLRVLGFTRSEVAGILFCEFAIEIALGILIGLPLSHAVIGLIARFHSNESFQIPAVIAPQTYFIAVSVVLAAAAASAYIVKGRVDRLDLVAALKTRE